MVSGGFMQFTKNTSKELCTWFVLCCGWGAVRFIHILQGYFNGTGATIWLPQCHWSHPEGYGYDCPNASDITLKDMGKMNHQQNKQNRAYTGCIILVMYSISNDLIHKFQNATVPYPSRLHSEQKCAHFCIDLIHKSQNAPVPYPTMPHSEKFAHFCSEWNIVGYGTGAFWDLWNWSIDWCTLIDQWFPGYCFNIKNAISLVQEFSL